MPDCSSTAVRIHGAIDPAVLGFSIAQNLFGCLTERARLWRVGESLSHESTKRPKLVKNRVAGAPLDTQADPSCFGAELVGRILTQEGTEAGRTTAREAVKHRVAWIRVRSDEQRDGHG